MFEDRNILSKTQRSQGLNQSWLLLKPDQHPKFSDVSAHLLHIFDLHHSCPNGLLLYMDGFVLPPFESTCILKDKDIISVKKKGGRSTNIVKVGDTTEEPEIVEKQPLHTGVPLLANEEFEKEAGGYQSESEKNEEQSEDTGVNAISKKRKASRKLHSSKKKKHRLMVPDGVDKGHHKDQIESNNDDGVFSRKSPCKKETTYKPKSKRNRESTPENAERSSSQTESTPSLKSDQVQENDKGIEVTLHTPNTTRKLPSRSARRKKAKRQWLRAMAKIGKKEVVCHTKGPLNQKQRRDKVEKKEVVCQSKGLLYWKQSHEGHNETRIVHKKPNEKNDGDGDIVPIVVRPGHIRFEPLEEDQAIQQSQVPTETFQWNGITSKRKGQKWGTEKILSTQRNVHQHFNKDHSDMSNIEKKITVNDPIMDFDKLLPLPSLPKEGDVIAYRLLELSSTWTPELSSFRVGRILWYKPESSTIMLLPVPEYPVVFEKLDEIHEDESVLQPDNSLYREDGSLEIDFSSLVDVRIVKHSNSDSGKAVTNKVNEGPLGNKDAISNLVHSNNDKQKHTPNTGNGDVNLWDHLSEALNAKKAELSAENNWSKGTSSRSAWSYRALRGSALGPTMALLRSKDRI